ARQGSALMAAAMQRRKLLILENDRALRRELEAVFSDLDVTACETSEQTLAIVRRTEPDAVLFDLGAAGEPAVAAQSLELLRQILNIDRKSTRLNSSHLGISYAVFCLKKKRLIPTYA